MFSFFSLIKGVTLILFVLKFSLSCFFGFKLFLSFLVMCCFVFFFLFFFPGVLVVYFLFDYSHCFCKKGFN